MSSGSVNSLEAARRDIAAGLRAMDATVRDLGQGMVKVYEEVYVRDNLKVGKKEGIFLLIIFRELNLDFSRN